MKRHHTATPRRRQLIRIASVAVVASGAMLAACASERTTAGGACIAPANPGGGWDFSCRAVAQMLGARAPGGQPLRVTNMPGEGGGVALKSILRAGHAHDAVIIAASPSTLLGLAQH